jgi:Kef-type K+ transport system membrane component KefB
MMDLFLFLSIIFLATLIIGRLIERIRVPWIFAALLIGTILAVSNPFSDITSSPTFIFLANIGMYFLLFIIGLELDVGEMVKRGRFIVKATLFIILLEALFGSLLIHFVFGYDWAIAFLVALSFATVGEAIIIPILDEFNIVNTSFGQLIIGIGTLDDVIEMLTLMIAILLVGSILTHFDISLMLVSLLFLGVLVIAFHAMRKFNRFFESLNIETIFFFTIFVLFLFLGIGGFSDTTALAALFAGISLKGFIPKKHFGTILKEVRTLGYGLFAPIFFLWVGLSLDINFLLSYPLLVLLVVVVSNGAKILGSLVVAGKKLGTKKSILLGTGLSIRFSTSIVVVKILFDGGIIGNALYSVIVASSIIFKFIIPVAFSNLLVRWKVVNQA